MNKFSTTRPTTRAAERERQQKMLLMHAPRLSHLSGQGRRDEFFELIAPHLEPLTRYIERRLRMARATGALPTNLVESKDILDEVILVAYEEFARKPAAVPVEPWLYWIAGQVLERNIHEEQFETMRRVSYDMLRERELRGLAEIERMTTDAEGEPILVDDLDPYDYQVRDFIPPSYDPDSIDTVADRMELRQILLALAELPLKDRIVFELSAIEGFSDEYVALIAGVSRDDVSCIVERVRNHVFDRLRATQGSTA